MHNLSKFQSGFSKISGLASLYISYSVTLQHVLKIPKQKRTLNVSFLTFYGCEKKERKRKPLELRY